MHSGVQMLPGVSFKTRASRPFTIGSRTGGQTPQTHTDADAAGIGMRLAIAMVVAFAWVSVLAGRLVGELSPN
jgi:hypothetical protein